MIPATRAAQSGAHSLQAAGPLAWDALALPPPQALAAPAPRFALRDGGLGLPTRHLQPPQEALEAAQPGVLPRLPQPPLAEQLAAPPEEEREEQRGPPQRQERPRAAA